MNPLDYIRYGSKALWRKAQYHFFKDRLEYETYDNPSQVYYLGWFRRTDTDQVIAFRDLEGRLVFFW